jgi:phospholipid/cholesterol/gamma-HCH transport system substrate-binding protein
MIRTFKLRYVNEIVGAFVLVCVGLVAAGVVAALRGKEWFQPVLHIKIFLPEAGSMGLRPGNNVQVLGTVIGSVDSINFNTEMEQFEAMVSVRGNLISYLRNTSIPIIHKSSFGIGEPYVEILKNPDPNRAGEPLPQIGAVLWYSEADTGPTEKVGEILTQMQSEVIPLLKQTRALITDLRDPDRPLQQSIVHLNTIIASVEKGEGLIGKLVSDPKLAEQINAMLPKINASLDETQGLIQDLHKTSGHLAEITADVQTNMKKLPDMLDSTKGTLDEVQATLKDVRKSTVKLPEVMDGLAQTVQALPGTVIQMQETLRQVQILVEGIQKSWLFRSNIDKGEGTGRIRPEDIGGVK